MVGHPADFGGQNVFGNQLEGLPRDLQVEIADDYPGELENLFSGHLIPPFSRAPPY